MVVMASPVEQFDRYPNWKGSREGGSRHLMCFMTSCSKHLMNMGVYECHWAVDGEELFGTGMMMVALRHVGPPK